MASSRSSEPSGGPTSTKPTSNSSRSSKRRSSAYDKNFDQRLNDHAIYPPRATQGPDNLKDIRQDVSVPRPSLSPSRFDDSAFEAFVQENDNVIFEHDAMTKIVPMLCGSTDIPTQQNVLFTELDSITKDATVTPKPDFFDGANLQDLSRDLQNDQALRSAVIPTKHPRVPVAPNFFLEAKRTEGNFAVMHRQARYDGAYGARAMQLRRGEASLR